VEPRFSLTGLGCTHHNAFCKKKKIQEHAQAQTKNKEHTLLSVYVFKEYV